jgi:hypothetical protein
MDIRLSSNIHYIKESILAVELLDIGQFEGYIGV